MMGIWPWETVLVQCVCSILLLQMRLFDWADATTIQHDRLLATNEWSSSIWTRSWHYFSHSIIFHPHCKVDFIFILKGIITEINPIHINVIWSLFIYYFLEKQKTFYWPCYLFHFGIFMGSYESEQPAHENVDLCYFHWHPLQVFVSLHS